MVFLSLLGALALAACLIVTLLVRNATRRWGVVDRPDNLRKLHKNPVPRLGGIAILLSYALVFVVLALAAKRWDISWIKELPFAWLTIIAVLIVFATGLMDDLRGLKPWQKLLGQSVAAIIAYLSGVQIHSIQAHELAAWWSLPLTVVWLVACSNAFNLIDGMDGLAAGIGFLATSTMFVAAWVHGNTGLMVVTLPLSAALLGFLRYNFNPASIFLGDCGSLSIGFLLGCFGVWWTDKSATLLGMAAPVMALAVPLLDASISVARRFLRHQSIFVSDRRHVHHRLLDQGKTPRQAVLLLYGGSAVAAVFSLLENSLHDQFGGLVIVLFCGIAFIGIQYLGYVEFGAATRLVVNGRLRKVVDAEVRLRIFSEQLARTENRQEWWDAMCAAYKEFGFEGVRLSAGDRILEESTGSSRQCWQVRVPFRDSGYINFYSSFDSQHQLNLLSSFIRVVEHSLGNKSFLFDAPVAVPPAKTAQSSVSRMKVRAVSGSL